MTTPPDPKTAVETTEQTDARYGPCGICSGKFSEHQSPNVAHVWVPEGGELLSRAEAAKRQRTPQQVIRVPMPQPGGDTQVINRLVEVLLDKKLITPQDGLYVAGVASKPSTQQYRDPFMDGSDNA